MSNPLERGVQKLFQSKAASGAPLSLDSPAGWPRLDLNSTEAAMKVAAVSACIEIISNSVAILPSFVMNEKTKDHLNNHQLGDILWRRPNEMMTPMRFRQMTEAQVLAQGNCYVWIYRDRTGTPVELIPLVDTSCQPWYDGAVGKWWYLARNPKTGEPHRLDPIDILHYKGFSLNGITGMSVLSRARHTIETARYMEQAQHSIYANGGRPSGVLTVDTDVGGVVDVVNEKGETVQLNRKDVIRREWERYNSGPGNAFRTAILDNGLKYQPITMTNADAQFVENKGVTVEDICRFFCMPPYKLGIGKQSYESNEQNNIEFAVQTLQPRITEREQEETWKLLTLSQQKKEHQVIKMNMAAILRADAKTRAQVEQIYRLMGVYSVNDICDLEDRPHVPGGDTRYGSLNYVPLEFFELLSMARNLPEDKSAGKEE